MGDGKTILHFQKGHVIFSQGDGADAAFFYIHVGKVKLTVVSRKGKEALVAMFEHGSFFLEARLAGEAVRLANTTAFGKTEIERFEKQAMIKMLHEESAFSELFMCYLLSRNIRIQEDL